MTSDLEAVLKQRLTTRQRETPYIEGFRTAAVLVPLLRTANGYDVLFTVRAASLSNHAGEIAFPGGRVDPGETLEQAAIREAHEEIGLAVPESAVIGLLDDAPTPAHYMVTPVVAVLDTPPGYALQISEVDEVFTAPLSVLSTTTPRAEPRVLAGHHRTIYFYPYENRMIWGFTGFVLKNLLDVLADKS